MQAFSSSHGALLALYTHLPVAPSQLSSVQGLLSLQLLSLPGTQASPLHKSPIVHGFSSLQFAPSSSWCSQPALGLQLSTVHGLLSLQSRATPPLHAPFGTYLPLCTRYYHCTARS